MGLLHKIASIAAREGLVGLSRRSFRRIVGYSRRRQKIEAARIAAGIEAARIDYERQASEFDAQIKRHGVSGLEHYYWYHTVDLGSGLVTPGDYDFRDEINSFGFPKDLTGKRALDVGSATGYFAFEFEKRGAEVVSVDLPSLSHWDMVSCEKNQVLIDLVNCSKARTAEEAYHHHLDGPFQFCHKMLGSKVSRCLSPIYELTLAKLGGEPFDLVYAGDILPHLFSPLKALDVLATVCADKLIISRDIGFQHPDQPYMRFMRQEGIVSDCRSWWIMSRLCLENMLKCVGFKTVSKVGEYAGFMRRDYWGAYHREVLLASKT
jgi:hypothetical protein